MALAIWKDIPGYEGLYQANPKGCIKSLRSGKVLSLFPRCGYSCCNLSVAGARKHKAAHLLVWDTFRKESRVGMYVDHIDDDKANPALVNLQLLTPRQNTAKIFKKKAVTSKYPGVYWSKDHGKWRTNMVLGGVKTHVGLFTDEKKAAQAYINALNEYNKGVEKNGE